MISAYGRHVMPALANRGQHRMGIDPITMSVCNNSCVTFIQLHGANGGEKQLSYNLNSRGNVVYGGSNDKERRRVQVLQFNPLGKESVLFKSISSIQFQKHKKTQTL